MECGFLVLWETNACATNLLFFLTLVMLSGAKHLGKILRFAQDDHHPAPKLLMGLEPMTSSLPRRCSTN
jgi:hypothetical protein